MGILLKARRRLVPGARGIKLTKGQQKQWEILQFLIRLIVLSLPIWMVMWLDVSMAPLQEVIAGQIAWMLRLSGMEASVDVFLITAGSDTPFSFFIGEDCTGWKSALAYLALIFATLKVDMRRRLYGIALGLPVIYAGNLARIMGVVMIERSSGLEAAMVVHDWLWQAGLIALVLVTWTAWMRLLAFPGTGTDGKAREK